MLSTITELKYTELTPAQYGKRHGMGEAAVRSRCEQGHIRAYKTEGGHWKIRDYPDDVVDRKAYDDLLKEKTELATIIEGMKRLLRL